MAHFANMPIKSPNKDDTYFDFFAARHVTQYLSDYIDQQIYCGRSLRQRVLLNSRVVKVGFSAETGQWLVACEGEPRPLLASKLLVAAGLTSRPNMPGLPGHEAFRGTVIHNLDFGKSSMRKDAELKHIAVLGGAKSAADLAYSVAKAGKLVSWIIRQSGSGPAHFAPAEGIGPYRNSNELLYTRLTASLSPSIWNPQNWLSGLLHGTRLGRKVVGLLWHKFDAQRKAGFSGQQGVDGSDKGYSSLEPDTPYVCNQENRADLLMLRHSMFWQNDSTGINQRPDFWETIAKNVQVYRQDIVQLKENSITLQEDEVEDVDAIICATGWRPSYETFFDKSSARDLGLPTPVRTHSLDTDKPHWQRADEAAETEINRLFPRLMHPPPHHHKPPSLSPFRLYRNMIPTNTQKYPGIVFLGHIAVGNNFRAADVQALWAVAYLSGSMKLPSQEEMEKEVALALAWCRKRYLSKGQLGHWLYYDLVPYTDRLLEDVGLSSHRRKGRLGDFWKPCTAEDLNGLLEELREKMDRKAV